MNSLLRKYLLLAFVVGIAGLAVMTLVGNHRATGAAGGCGSCAINVGAATTGGDPVGSAAVTSAKVESPVVLNAAEGAEPKVEAPMHSMPKDASGNMVKMMPMCPACKAAGAMCAQCKEGGMQKCGAKLGELKASIDAAKVAADAGDAKAAAAELAKAQALVTAMQDMHKAMIAKPAAAAADGQVINAKCPIMGTKLDPAKVPAELRRVFNGQTVGFCCAGCPAAWDKLSDAEKQAKLDASMKSE